VPDHRATGTGIQRWRILRLAIACAITALLLLRFPIDRKRHEEIQRALRERYAAAGRLR
jgi:Na+/melibiose symporter-like transporter